MPALSALPASPLRLPRQRTLHRTLGRIIERILERIHQRAIVRAIAIGTLAAAAQPAAADAPATLQRPDIVVLLRHANAPGIGDPPGFRIDDCATQRNLDTAGREQARALGMRWRAAGFRPRAIWSSAWCRCQETASLLDAGPVTVLPALNSFFGDDAARARQTAALQRFLQGLDPRGGPYLLVTHQVNITALSGASVASADGVIVELSAEGGLRGMRPLHARPQ